MKAYRLNNLQLNISADMFDVMIFPGVTVKHFREYVWYYGFFRCVWCYDFPDVAVKYFREYIMIIPDVSVKYFLGICSVLRFFQKYQIMCLISNVSIWKIISKLWILFQCWNDLGFKSFIDLLQPQVIHLNTISFHGLNWPHSMFYLYYYRVDIKITFHTVHSISGIFYNCS